MQQHQWQIRMCRAEHRKADGLQPVEEQVMHGEYADGEHDRTPVPVDEQQAQQHEHAKMDSVVPPASWMCSATTAALHTVSSMQESIVPRSRKYARVPTSSSAVPTENASGMAS